MSLPKGRNSTSTTTYPLVRLRGDKGEFVIVYGVNHETVGAVTYASFTLYADQERWLGMKDAGK